MYLSSSSDVFDSDDPDEDDEDSESEELEFFSEELEPAPLRLTERFSRFEVLDVLVVNVVPGTVRVFGVFSLVLNLVGRGTEGVIIVDVYAVALLPDA